MLPEKVKNVAKRIGDFYLIKNRGNYSQTEKEIRELCITKLNVDVNPTSERRIYITTARPGLLIGRKGENVEKLEKYLGGKIHIFEEPDCLLDNLIPRDYFKNEYYNECYDDYYDDYPFNAHKDI